jgi:hypothetical protein
MKYCYLFFIFLFFAAVPVRSQVIPRIDFNFQLAGRPEIGWHFLSDAHSSKGPGVVWDMTFFDFKGLRAGFGARRAAFMIDKKNIMGNFYVSRYRYHHLQVEYDVPITRHFSFVASYGMGRVAIRQRSESGALYGTMTGYGTHLGGHLEWKLTKWFALTTGGDYMYHRMSAKAPEAFKGYFRHVHQFWLGGGLKFIIWEQQPKNNRIRYKDIYKEETRD